MAHAPNTVPNMVLDQTFRIITDNPYYYVYTVKPVLRGQLGTKKKWSFKTGDLLKEVPFI